MAKYEYLVIENFQDITVDESGTTVMDENGQALYADVWTDGETEFEGDLTQVLNELGAEGWEAVATTGDEFIATVVLKREL